MDRGELIFTVILMFGGAAGFVYSLFLPSHGNIALSPGLFPGVVSLLLFLLNIFHLVLSVKNGKLTRGRKTGTNRNLLLILSFFPVYLILLYYLHFIFSTIIFLILTMSLLHKHFHWRIPLVSVFTVIVIYYLFSNLLKVRMP